MNRFLNLIKESLIEKKYVILILGGIIGLLSYYVVYIIEDMDLQGLKELGEIYPEEMLKFFGGIEVFTNPYGFWSLELMSFMWLYAGIYILYMASGLLSQEIEDKTIDLSLSKPIKRNYFLTSKIVFLYVFTFAALGIVFLISMVSIAGSPTFHDEGLYFDRLWATYFTVVLYLTAFAMIAFFFSTIFLSTRKSMALGVMALFLMFFLGEFYSYMDEGIQGIKYISIFYYFNPLDYMVYADKAIFIRDMIVLISLNAVLIVASLTIFNKKDIPN